MILDSDDLLILRAYLNLKDKNHITDWTIMRSIYKKGGNREYGMFHRRIRKMAKYGLFFIDEENYILISDRVKFHKIKMDGKVCDCICFYSVPDHKWNAVEI